MPIDINKETLDYLSDQLASTVRGTVEATIFRTYRNAAAVAVAVLGAVGVTVGWPTIRSTIDAEIAAKVDKPVAAAEELAKKAREDADHILVETDTRMDALRNEINRLETRRDALQDATNKMEENSQEISSRIDGNKRSLQDLEQSLSQRAQTLDQRFATIGMSDEISTQLGISVSKWRSSKRRSDRWRIRSIIPTRLPPPPAFPRKSRKSRASCRRYRQRLTRSRAMPITKESQRFLYSLQVDHAAKLLN